MSRIVCACHYYPESLCPENEVTTQPEALRLADRLTLSDYYEFDAALHCSQAAAELRRQHDEIEQLKAERDALKAAAEKGTEYVLAHINQDLRAEIEKANACIRKVEAERDALLAAAELMTAAIDAARGE